MFRLVLPFIWNFVEQTEIHIVIWVIMQDSPAYNIFRCFFRYLQDSPV